MGSFNVLAYLPCDAAFHASYTVALPLTNRFATFVESLITVPRLVLNCGLSDDAEPIRRVGILGGAFIAISNERRRFTPRITVLCMAAGTARASPHTAGTHIEMLPPLAWKEVTGHADGE